MRALKTLVLCLMTSSILPAYLVIAAYGARIGPWPRTSARPLSYVLCYIAVASWIILLSRTILRSGGWAEVMFGLPNAVTRQLRRAIRVLTLAAIVLLLPRGLLEGGMLAPSDRPISAASTSRLLGLAYGLIVLGVAFRLLRKRSSLVQMIDEITDRPGWSIHYRRPMAWAVMTIIGATLALDAAGFGYAARRLATSGLPSLLFVAIAFTIRHFALKAVEEQSWRWLAAGGGPAGEPGEQTPEALRRLVRLFIPALGILACAWAWEMDLAMFRSIGGIPIPLTGQSGPDGSVTSLTVGDVSQALAILLLTAFAWKHVATVFDLLVFPRIPDDAGVRFAMLTLGRYTALGLGTLGVLSSVHLGMKEISVVLAALGVGLGFGLQEIVSNFISGIILLLERPIRVGDLVTVAGMTGTVDRINIRATTINNYDNHSMIVPNRAFITGNLVNWTLNDRVVRASIQMRVALDTDPDKATDLLLNIAREDADVLRNPLPVAFMESFGEFALCLVLHVHVPDPSLSGRVKHRLCSQIQKRFEAAGIRMAQPIRELLVKQPDPADFKSSVAIVSATRPNASTRVDPPAIQASATPHTHRAAPPVAKVPPPLTIDPGTRCVDE